MLQFPLMSAVCSPGPPRYAQESPTLTCDQIAQGFRYDPASQVTQILHQLGASGPTINQAAYAYNGVGNRTSVTDRRGSQNFGYDNLDRLTSASHPLLGTAQAFAYDAVGNRTTAGNVTNAGNQLTADATHSYQYDDNGNLTRKTLLATGNYSQYTYDAENRLTTVEDFAAGNPTAAFTSTYRYDGLGRRIEKVTNGQTKRYIYDGEDILLEYDGSNVLQARYTHGPGIDEPIAVTKGANTFFYHQDGLGSVTDLTDSAGATVKSYSYDAYGNILESPGTLEQSYTYTGREFDSESGRYYYRARSYDPTTGRFLQKDPSGFVGGDPNLYAYVLNNPMFWLDPFGLEPRSTLGGDDPGFLEPEKTIKELEKQLKDPELCQRDKEQIRRRIKELRRRPSRNQEHHRESANVPPLTLPPTAPVPVDPIPPTTVPKAPQVPPFTARPPIFVRPFFPAFP